MKSDVKTRLYAVIGAIALSLLFLLPTCFPSVFGPNGSVTTWVSKPLSLGLDLKGGVHLVYRVETGEALKSKLQTIGNNNRADLISKKIAVFSAKANDAGAVSFSLSSEAMADKAKEELDKNKDLIFISKEFDGSRVKLNYTVSEQFKTTTKIGSVNQAVETLRNRVDQFGVSEPLIQRIGEDRVMLQMPGLKDIEALKRIVGTVAKLEFRLTALDKASGVTLQDKQGSKYTVEDDVKMGGDAVDNAQVSIDPSHGVQVILNLNSDGAKAFRRITTDFTGRNLAIILDNKVFSSPRINEPIPNGQAVISGGFTPEEARELAVVLRAGALPAPLTVLEERTVGPTLGEESIRSGIMATVVGLTFIIIFMCVYYKKSGCMASVTLVLNLLLLLATLSAFGATLTLPGIAGLALTLGIAVDSNVIIFERIRDELVSGAVRDTAIDSGFHKAYSALIDANITSLLTSIVLYIFGTGPIRGFAVTLSIGILTTLFCAIFVARLCFDMFEMKTSEGKLSI